VNPETLEALQGSIQKWRDIVAETEEDNFADNCALCQRFNQSGCKTADGELCPVAIRANMDGCDNTPWVEWHFQQVRWGHRHQDRRADTDELRALAQVELDFLISLLPKEVPSES